MALGVISINRLQRLLFPDARGDIQSVGSARSRHPAVVLVAASIRIAERLWKLDPFFSADQDLT